MRRKSNTRKVKFPAKLAKIPLKVPDGHLGICLCTKKVAFVAYAAEIAEKQFTQLATKGYKAMSVALPQNFEDEIVKVTIFFEKSKHLTRPKTGIKNRKGHKVSTDEVNPYGLMGDEHADCICP
jgi:hypothetical protein